jgi:hypothetical protein
MKVLASDQVGDRSVVQRNIAGKGCGGGHQGTRQSQGEFHNCLQARKE